MNELKILMVSFFVLLILSFPFYQISKNISIIFLIILGSILAIGIYIFISKNEVKKIGKIKIEKTQFPFSYVLRAYTEPKNLWIVFDERDKIFRPADLREVPVKVFLVTFFGLIFLYVSYLISFTITQVLSLFLFRATILFIFVFIGLYSTFVGLYRILSFGTKNAEKICRYMNRFKSLKNLINKGKVHAEVTPNFLVKEGFVTSLEIIIPEKFKIKKLEKILIKIAKKINRIK